MRSPAASMARCAFCRPTRCAADGPLVPHGFRLAASPPALGLGGGWGSVWESLLTHGSSSPASYYPRQLVSGICHRATKLLNPSWMMIGFLWGLGT